MGGASWAIEALNWRLEATARIDWPDMLYRPDAGPTIASARTRAVYFRDTGRFVETAIFAEEELADGASRDGPALIEQAGSTIVAGPGDRFAMDLNGNIRLTLGAAEA